MQKWNELQPWNAWPAIKPGCGLMQKWNELQQYYGEESPKDVVV